MKRAKPRPRDFAVEEALAEMRKPAVGVQLTRKQLEQVRNILSTFGTIQRCAGMTEGEKRAQLDAAAFLASEALGPRRGQRVVIELAGEPR